ncbi:hypothetical protein FQZ97_1020580 [compost metagenome]
MLFRNTKHFYSENVKILQADVIQRHYPCGSGLHLYGIQLMDHGEGFARRVPVGASLVTGSKCYSQSQQ